MWEKTLTDSKIPLHEMMQIGICLALVGGFLDAHTYLFRDGVFANAQTGNMVLMGISIAERNFLRAGYYLVPVFAFFLGVAVTEILKRQFLESKFANWQHITLGIEAVCLFIIGFLPQQVPPAFINVTVSFVCSLQVNSFRKISGAPYASTMCTGNLRSATEQLCLFWFDRKKEAGIKCLRYFIIILAFCCGAAGGALLTKLWKEKSVWVCCIILVAVLGIMLWDNRKQYRSQTESE